MIAAIAPVLDLGSDGNLMISVEPIVIPNNQIEGCGHCSSWNGHLRRHQEMFGITGTQGHVYWSRRSPAQTHCALPNQTTVTFTSPRRQAHLERNLFMI